MYPSQLSLEKFDLILRSINQAQLRLKGIEQRRALRPMKYCARLAWEALYEVRQVLAKGFGSSTAYSTRQHRNEVITNELTQIERTVEQVMSTLQAIETNDDMSSMQAAAQNCLQHLNEITHILSGLISTHFDTTTALKSA